jgi:hypothetical protein
MQCFKTSQRSGVVWVGVLALLVGSATPVRAAWCNVFQVTCFPRLRKSQTAVSYYYVPAPAAVSYYAPAPCPQPCAPVCTTRYVQRCYYQPVVSYQTRSYYEPVTTYRTSYYYEPVTSYRYTSYYDPCSCSYQQSACPTTSYQLRSQTCAVQSWVQRCTTVPVTTYQQASYWEPVTTCSAPPASPCCTPTAAPCPTSDCAPVPTAPPATQPPPTATEPQIPAPPGITENPGHTGTSNPQYRYYQNPGPTPPASGSSYRQVVPNGSALPQRTTPPPPLPNVRLDRIVAVPMGQVEGQVVRRDSLPWAGAQLLFVSVDRGMQRQAIAADGTGHFRVGLASGAWLVYLQGADGKPIFHHKIELLGNETRQVNFVAG